MPGVVLIHGGGGTRLPTGQVVELARLCGDRDGSLWLCARLGRYGKWERHPEGGPPGWDASFDQINGPLEDQWQMHAVSAVALANSLLRSFPEVDADRVESPVFRGAAI